MLIKGNIVRLQLAIQVFAVQGQGHACTDARQSRLWPGPVICSLLRSSGGCFTKTKFDLSSTLRSTGILSCATKIQVS